MCFVLFVFLFNTDTQGNLDLETLEGRKYTKGDYAGRLLFVTFLKNDYIIEKRPERHPDLPKAIAPPYETSVRAYIIKSNKILKRIDSLNDLQGFVRIDSLEKAVEFVRLLTSGHTYFLFRPNIMIEVFKGSSKENRIIGECNPEFFKKHKLKNLEIELKEGFFEIKRYVVMLSWPLSKKNHDTSPFLYKIVEKVFPDGKYIVEKTKIMERIEFNDIPYLLEPE